MRQSGGKTGPQLLEPEQVRQADCGAGQGTGGQRTPPSLASLTAFQGDCSEVCLRSSLNCLCPCCHKAALGHHTSQLQVFTEKIRSPLFKHSLTYPLPLTEPSALRMDTESHTLGGRAKPLPEAAQRPHQA